MHKIWKFGILFEGAVSQIKVLISIQFHRSVNPNILSPTANSYLSANDTKNYTVQNNKILAKVYL